MKVQNITKTGFKNFKSIHRASYFLHKCSFLIVEEIFQVHYDRFLQTELGKIYQQQYHLFTTGISPKNRIIRISKDYLHPIVRGKEVKRVEFGAKVHKLQINGINFIEHLNFWAYHEGRRFQSTVFMAQLLTRKRVKIVGADTIYATNNNRCFATQNNIRTDFIRKGRVGKHEAARQQLASMIRKERTSRMEGSFGREKQHYYLKKIKARTLQTEILWIFFGIHTANALEIGRRMSNAKLNKAA